MWCTKPLRSEVVHYQTVTNITPIFSGEVVSTTCVSRWDKESTLSAIGYLLAHPLTRMVLTSLINSAPGSEVNANFVVSRIHDVD